MKINIEYKISELSNLYSFVGDLSQWSPSIFPLRKKEWIERTGALTKSDYQILNEFKKIHIENQLLFLNFFDPKCQIPWNCIENKTGKNKSAKLKNILEYFQPRFNKIWPEEKTKLQMLKTGLEKKFNSRSKAPRKIISLCNFKEDEINITSYLILSASSHPDCNCWTSENVITLECSGWPRKRFNEISDEIIPHELFHILLRKNKPLISKIRTATNENTSLLSKINLEKWKASMVLEELIISSFIPEGYLTRKTPKKPSGIKDFQSIREEFAYLLHDKAKEYVRFQKKIDQNYIDSVIDKLKKRTG